MSSLSITKRVEFKWKVFGNYYISNDRKLYNSKTMHEKKKTIKNSTVGYWIGKKFYSLSQINLLAEKIDKTTCPF